MMDNKMYRILWVLFTFFVIVGLGIFFGGFYVISVKRAELEEQAKKVLPNEKVVVPNYRGNICAEDGRLLATSVPYYKVYFDPVVCDTEVFNQKIDSLAFCLSRFYGDNTSKVYKNKIVRARNSRRRYIQINNKDLTHLELTKLKQFPIFNLGKNKGGLIVETYDRRIQPHKNLANRTIGYINESASGLKTGRVGLEQSFESYLKGTEGYGLKRKEAGSWITIVTDEPISGDDVITTIDVDYQDVVQSALERQLRRSDAANGTAILMEVETGDIKAIANLTRVNNGVYVENSNYAIADAGEPGSVIKTATMICLLESGAVKAGDVFDIGQTGVYKFYDKQLRESEKELRGRLTAEQIFSKSSNYISVLVNNFYKKNPKKYVNRLYAMGLNEKTGICIAGEGTPVIKYPEDKSWSGITLPWMSIGYELRLTPLQVLAFYNAVANNGQRMEPRLVKEIRSNGELVKSFHTKKVGSKICSRSTLKTIRGMLEEVVETGTGRFIKTDQYKIAGKTGTARLATDGSGYDYGSYKASFAGYFPADKPQYSCIVVINKPRNGYYASTVAAPVFKEISDKVYTMSFVKKGRTEQFVEPSVPVSKNGYKTDFSVISKTLGIGLDGVESVKENDWVLTSSAESDNLTLKPRRITENFVPNVKGMGLKDALFALESVGLRVGVSGSGMVQSQSLQAGTKFVRGNYIKIELR